MSDIEIIETTEGTAFEVDIFEAFPAVGEANPELNHNKLNNRAISDQHPIGAITGLEKELEDIKALKTVYSDKIGVANYYKWDGDAAYDTFGYFVSLVTHNSTIKICDGGDIFGVTVNNAAFVGNQNKEIPRDNKYGLVVTSGPVDVRCESDVEEGDYVICNGRGEAKKTTTECGYKVIAINLEKTSQYGTTYATIALGVQACTTDALGKDLQSLASRVGNNEQNIVSAINVANQAYNKSTQSTTVSEEAVRKALEAIKKADDAVGATDTMNNALTNLSSTVAQARALADAAATSATAIKDEAMKRANDAWAKAGEVATEAQSLCAKIDKYSVGEYSQAYGLTFEQAQDILRPGMIYVPTEHETVRYHKEEYSYTEGKETKTYTRWFTPGYLYEWGELSNGKYGWLTIGNNAVVTNTEDYSNSDGLVVPNIGPWVYFSTVEPTIHESWEYGYWYTDGKTITAKDGSTDKYESYTLYKWETDHWVAVATLKGNASNRMISEIYQTTNEIMMGVINPRGGIAAFNAKLTDTESKAQTTAQWAKGTDESGNTLYNITTIDQSADQDGSSLTLVVADVNGNKVLNGASIVLAQEEDGESYISLDANRINFGGNGTEQMTIAANNIDFTAEDYGVIAENITLRADRLDFGGGDTEEIKLNADNINFEGSQFSSTISNTYSTKLETAEAKNAAIASANSSTDEKLKSYSTIKQLDNAISTKVENSIYESGLKQLADQMVAKVHEKETGDNCSWTMSPSEFKVSAVASDKEGGITVDTNGLTVDGIVNAQAGGSIGGWDIANIGVNNRNDNSNIGIYKNGEVSVGLAALGGRGHVAFWAGSAYYQEGESSEVAGKTPWEIYNLLEEQGKDSNEWSSYVPFFVEGGGKVHCSNLEADGGTIGDLEIDNGSLRLIEGSASKIQIGDVSFGCDSSNSLSYIETSGPFVLRGQNDTELCFMQNDSGSSISEDVKVYCKQDTSYKGFLCYTTYLYIDTPCLYDFSVTVKYKFTAANNTATAPQSKTFNFKSGDQTTTSQSLFYSASETGVSVSSALTGIKFYQNDDTWSDAVKTGTATTEYVEAAVVDHIDQRQANNYIAVKGHLMPSSSATDSNNDKVGEGGYNLGISTAFWNTVFAKTGTINTSDKNEKNTISPLSDTHEQIFDALEPVSYKFKVNNNNRTHTGFIAQDVKAAVENAGLTTQDFAAYCEWEKDDGTIGCGLRYEEFIALCVSEIQKLKKRVNELEEKLDATK